MSRSILLVDDDPHLLNALLKVLHPLTRQDTAIQTCPSAREAIEILSQQSVDLVITDEHMQGMKGTELLSWISRHASGTRRILLTGDISLSPIVDGSHQDGIDAYLIKPFNNEELLNATTAALDRNN